MIQRRRHHGADTPAVMSVRGPACSQGEQPDRVSSDVRCGSVAMRQVPRQPWASCTAATTLVLPASITSSIGSPAIRPKSVADLTSPAAKASPARRPAQQRAIPAQPGEANRGGLGRRARSGARRPRRRTGKEGGAKPGRGGARPRPSAPAQRLQHLPRHAAAVAAGAAAGQAVGRSGTSGAIARLAPIPSESQDRPPCPSAALSARMPAILRPCSSTSFGHFNASAAPPSAISPGRWSDQRLGQRHPGQQRPLRRLARRAARPQQTPRGTGCPRPPPMAGHGCRDRRSAGAPGWPTPPARRPRRQGGRGRRWKGGFRKPPAATRSMRS